MNAPRFSNRSRTWVHAALLGIAALVVTLIVYQFAPPLSINIGSGGDAPLIRGFSFRENLPDGSNVRWSGGDAEIHFVGLGAQDGNLILRLAAPRPNAPAAFRLQANGVDITRDPPGNDFAEQSYAIDRATIGWGGDLVLHLTGDTFIQPPDTRELGLLVDSARFESAGAPILPSPRVLFYFPALVMLVFGIARAWSGSGRAAIAIGILAILLGAYGLLNARLETAYFLVPLFWTALFLSAAAWLLSIGLQRLAGALDTSPLDARTLRLLFLGMAVAFGVRMLFATGPGYIVDVQDYVVWSYKTVTHGIGTAYVALDGLWAADNPPGMVYVFDAMGRLYRAVFAPDFLYPAVAGDPNLRGMTENVAALADPVHRTLLRLPFLLSDLVTGALIFVAARKFVNARLAAVLACAFWFNPAVLWNGSYWGQTDALFSLLVLAAFLLLNVRHIGAGFFVYALAALIKPQATIFAPLLLLYAWRLNAWRGLARAVVLGALGAGLVLLPMVLSGGAPSMVNFFLNVAGFHPVLSANAHNVWWFVRGGDVDIVDTQAIMSGVPLSFRVTSLLLFGGVYLAVLWRAWRAALDDFFELGAFVAFSFFMLVTEIHENHGYALLPLLAVAMARDLKLIVVYALSSLAMTLNYALHDPPLLEQVSVLNSNTLRWLNSLLNMLVFTGWALYLFVRRRELPAHLQKFQPSSVM